MWPAIWLLPVDSVYGAWPLSGNLLSSSTSYPNSFNPPGEIDMVESRGNGIRYTAQYVLPIQLATNAPTHPLTEAPTLSKAPSTGASPKSSTACQRRTVGGRSAERALRASFTRMLWNGRKISCAFSSFSLSLSLSENNGSPPSFFF